MPYDDVNPRTAADSQPEPTASVTCDRGLTRLMRKADLPVVEYELTMDAKLVLRDANAAAEAALGIDLTRQAGLAIELVSPALVGTPVIERLRRVAETGVPYTGDMVLTRDGDTRVQNAYRVSVFEVAPRRIAGVFADVVEPVRTERVLRQLVAASASPAGPDFLNDLTRSLSSVLNADAVIVGELLPDPPARIAAIAIALDGVASGGISCEVADSPFRDVLAHGVHVVPSGLCEQYPRDVLIQVTQCQAGVGCCLYGSGGQIIGVVAALFRSAIDDDEAISAVLRIVAARVAGEVERARTDAALRASERQFRALIENSSDMTVVVDFSGQIVFESASAGRLLGYATGGLLGRNALDLIHPDDAEEVRIRLVDLARAEGPGSAVEARVRCADGAWACLEFVGQNLITDPTVRGFLLSGRDVTERRRAEEARRVSEARIRSFFDSPMVGAAIWLPEGPCVEANGRFCRMLGYEREELLRMTWMEVTHPDDLAAEMGKQRSVGWGAAESCTREKRYVRRDGSVVDARVYTGCVRRPDGSVDHYVSVVEDLCERRWLEQELRLSEERRRQLVEASNDCLWEIDAQGLFTFCSHHVRDILGYEPDELIGQRPTRFVASEELERRGAQFGQMLGSGGTFKGLRCLTRHKDGSVLQVEINATPFLGADGRLAGYRGALQRAA